VLARALALTLLVALAVTPAILATSVSTRADYTWNSDYAELTGIVSYALLGENIGGALMTPGVRATNVTILVDDHSAGNLVAIDVCQLDASGVCVDRAVFCENGKLHLVSPVNAVQVLVLSREAVHGCPLSLPAYPEGGTITALWQS